MIKNYIKIAWRNFRKHRGYSFINIIGLSIGMSLALIIGLWIISEYHYDRFYTKTDRLSQVYTIDTFEGKQHTWGGTPAVLGPILKQEHPEIEAVVRTAGLEHTLDAGEDRFKTGGLATDPDFFNLFDFRFIDGNPTTVLSEPNAIVITETLAQQLFGSTQVVGKTIHLDTIATMDVKAVIRDIPANSTFYPYKFFCSWDVMKKLGWGGSDSWTSYNHQTYALLKEGASLEAVNRNITGLVQKHTNNEVKASIYLYPATRWHLYDKSDNGKMVEGNLVTVRLFAVIGFFILLIACINFINLTTASAEKRIKEVSVRKIVGAPKSSLILQFLCDSFLLTSLASILAMVIVTLCLPAFNNLFKSDIHIFDYPWLLFGIFTAISLFAAMGSGIYPAFVLSAINPIKSLKGVSLTTKRGFTPRKILVVFQFTTSICLGICTIIIGQQIRYGQQRDSGYDSKNLLYLPLEGQLTQNYEIVRNELLQQGIASHVTKTSGRITHYSGNSWGYSWPNSKPEDFDVVFNNMSSDADFVNTMGLKLIAGRDIDIYRHPADSNAIMLNEAAVKRMGLADPLGAQIIAGKGTEYEQHWEVVGIVNDFIWTSPYQSIDPMLIKGPNNWPNYIHLRLANSNDLGATIAKIKGIIKTYNPDYPTDIHFADEAYASKFVQQKRTEKLTAVFSTLSIFIACLGLLGLVSFATVQKQKEIGIRKVLGASVAGVVNMLSKDFLKLVLVSIVIASPIAWWMMNRWLDSFSYRTELHWWMFALAGIIAIIIAIITISYQAIRAAVANPVDSLRDE